MPDPTPSKLFYLPSHRPPAPGDIISFRGHFDYLSNFYPMPFVFQGIRWPTREHCFQAYKSLDLKERLEIRDIDTPGHAKTAGRKVTLRPDWEEVKIPLMFAINRAAFYTHKPKAQALARTNAGLYEGNTWHDRFWGVVQNATTGEWEGENWLGRILMSLRIDLKAMGLHLTQEPI